MNFSRVFFSPTDTDVANKHIKDTKVQQNGTSLLQYLFYHPQQNTHTQIAKILGKIDTIGKGRI